MNRSTFNLDTILFHCESPKKSLLSAPWEDPAFYSQWLAQTTYFVSHSSRLLALCAAHCPMEKQNFHLRFLAHAAEEKGHEKMAQKDLSQLGYSLHDLPELSSTQSFYQPQYYWIQYKSPLAFLGYIFCLELLAKEVGPFIYKKVLDSYGGKAQLFIRVHAEEDEDHVEKAVELLQLLNEEEQQYALANLQQSCQNYEQILRDCLTQRGFKKQAA